MLLMFSMGLQAVLVLLFFSPSAPPNLRGLPVEDLLTPPSRCRFGPPASPGGPSSQLGPGPDRFSRSRAGLPSLLAEDAWSGPDRRRAGPGPDPDSGSSAGRGGRVLGLPTAGGPGEARSVPTPRGRCVVVCVCGCGCGADPAPSRGLDVDSVAPHRRRRSAAHGGPHGAAWLTPCRASALFTPSRVLAGTGSRPLASSPSGAAGCASKSCNPAALAPLRASSPLNCSAGGLSDGPLRSPPCVCWFAYATKQGS
jgi:hypothetical protein